MKEKASHSCLVSSCFIHFSINSSSYWQTISPSTYNHYFC